MATKPSLRLSLALSLLLVACGGTGPAGPPAIGSASPGSAARPATAPPVPRATARPLPSSIGEYGSVRQPDGTFSFEPISARVTPGIVYAYTAFTHCGITPTTFDFDGSFWDVVGGAGGGGLGPPAGLADPEDAGTIALVGPDAAVFTAAGGRLVPLRRVAGPRDAFPCD